MVSITAPITKAKAGITGKYGALNRPARFIISLGIGFALGVIADVIMQYIYRNFIAMHIEPAWGSRPPIPFWYYKYPDIKRIAWDDLFMTIITIAMLFTKKFVLTLGFFLGWYISSNEGLAQLLPQIPTELAK